ncbi:MAG: CDP-diacylglycerol--glycerol-3-phosphate 3-phosphatidyltransferase [Clostridia bacterium]|nr:CDP-diacylglycerol--glycerol-3-phosphate 3-phosphatidyltransferase [Clostridia bacterium]
MKLNIPNQLTLLRMLLIPVFVACYIYIENPLTAGIVAAILFAVASLTDMLDGKIARKYNLVTNFGKVMDPLADKALVFAAFLLLSAKVENLDGIMIWATVIVFIRELGVTSIRLACAKSEVSLAANFFGKAKTVTQMACILVVLIENALIVSGTIDLGAFNYVASFVLIIAMSFMTVASGINYVKVYMPYLNSNN